VQSKLPGILAALLVVILFFYPAQQSKADEQVKVEAVPDWVIPLDIPQANETRLGEVQGGIYYLLRDVQVRVLPGGNDYLAHTAYRITDREGLEQAASLQESFDPANGSLAFNYVRIVRDGKPIDALAPKDILVLRREQQMERGVFDGMLTAHLELRDLRVGDIVDYAVIWHTRTPLWPNDFFGGLETDWSVPLALQQYRLIWPKDRALSIQSTDPKIAPVVTEAGANKIYQWRIVDAEPRPSEGNLPKGFDIYNQVRLSTMDDWRTVSRWAFGLYSKPNPLPPETLAQVDAIAKANADPADRITEAVRLVEDTIRYVSIDIGPGSYVARPAATIVHDGFGDCKDKSTLLVAILRALGVEAYPALTDTDDGPGLPGRLATTRAFNHMIAMIRYQGGTYWIDPTLSHQGGRFPHIWYPDHGYALPIVEGGSDLLPVVYPKGTGNTLSATEHFVLNPATKTYTLNTDTVYREDEADDIRVKLAGKGRDRFNKENIDYYKKTYPDLVPDGAVTISDDRDRNQITVSEHYRMTKGADAFGKYTPYVPSSVRGLFANLPGNRLYPYAINPDLRLDNTVVVESPGADIVKIKNVDIDNPQFKFSLHVTTRPNMLSMAYDIRTRDRQVPLPDYAKFRTDADRLDDASWHTIGLEIAQNNAKARGATGHVYRAAGIGIFVLALFAAAILLMIFGARYGLAADREHARQAAYYPVSLTKFIVMSIMTSGVYCAFWLWKCWRWIKLRDERDILPFWRALFSIIWWDALFQNIRLRDPAAASPRWVGLASWALFAGLSVGGYVLTRLHHPAAGFALQMLAPFCFVPTVLAVNRLNAADIITLHRNSRFTGWNVAGIAVGGLVLAFTLLQMADPGWITATVKMPS